MDGGPQAHCLPFCSAHKHFSKDLFGAMSAQGVRGMIIFKWVGWERQEGKKASDAEVTTVMKEGFLQGTSKEQPPLASKELCAGLSPTGVSRDERRAWGGECSTSRTWADLWPPLPVHTQGLRGSFPLQRCPMQEGQAFAPKGHTYGALMVMPMGSGGWNTKWW